MQSPSSDCDQAVAIQQRQARQNLQAGEKVKMKRICISCGTTRQRSSKSWRLWNQCINCAKKNNPDYYNAMKCSDCDATSNNTTALCWRIYGKCGKCAYKKPDHRTHVLCKDCNEVTYKLSYQKLGRHPISLFYCIKCSGIVTKNSHRIFQMREQIVATSTRIWRDVK